MSRTYLTLSVAAAIALAGALAALPAHAADAPATPSIAAAASASAAAEANDAAATLMVLNRPIARFQAALPGVSPAERARRAQAEVLRVLQAGGTGVVSVATTTQGDFMMIDDVGVFALLPGDLGGGQTVKSVAHALELVVAEDHEAHSLRLLAWGALFAALATLVLAGAIWLLRRLRYLLARSLVSLGHRHSQRLALGGKALISRDRVFSTARGITTLIYFLLLLILASEWLGFVLRQFPYTRRWGEQLNESGLELAGQIFGAIAASLPGLAVAAAIFLIAHGVLGLTKSFFAQVERGDLSLPWIDKYTVRATRALVHMGVWLFALAMAYPYLPGAQTEAFKGISVVLGVMLSLGSSNVVGQAISGLILTYSQTLHIGEYVRVGDAEGTVTQMSTFATRIRTGMGEELTLPNSLIVGAVTKNYSRAVKGVGYVVDTVLTIGYDTPWRQVHAMMIAAAQRTEGILAEPAPVVFQTALSDFYVEYRLVAQAIALQPRPRAQVLNDLHANLQDVFNENGVQIMSPHYLSDPADAKVVPPAQWSPGLRGEYTPPKANG